jgi:hypothetical protein
VAALPPAEWAPFQQVFSRAMELVGSAELAALDLTRRFRNNKLTMGVRWVLRKTDAAGMPLEICLICRPQYWKRAVIKDRGADRPAVITRTALYHKGRRVVARSYFFVRRAELDWLSESYEPPKLTAKEWFTQALKHYPRQREHVSTYARRLLEIMQTELGEAAWKFNTIRRRLHD